jgi:formiminotetrahydrofolate cyclodeaminase
MSPRSSWGSATLSEFVTALAEPGPVPAAGAAAALACASAAALVELALGPEDPDGSRAAELRRRALELADLDEAAYEALHSAQRAGEPEGLEAARREASGPPLEIAESAAQLVELAAEAERRAPAPRRGDAAAAASIAWGACRAALSLVEANMGEAPATEPPLARARALAERVAKWGAG